MRRGEVKPGSATALVTGAGRGLGRAYAEQLARLGYNLILVGRSSTVADTASEISSSFKEIETVPIIMDLAVPGAAQELYHKVKEMDRQVDVLVNNAGMFSFRDITETDPEVVERMLTLHNLTLIQLCRLFAGDMIQRGGGHILNMSSFSIYMPLPGIAIYSGSKACTKAFTLAFSKEVQENGVYVTAICPAGIATDLYGLSRRMQRIGIRFGVLITPDKCAKLALKALWKHKRCVVPDWWNCLFIPILTHLPGWLERIIRRKTMQFQK